MDRAGNSGKRHMNHSTCAPRDSSSDRPVTGIADAAASSGICRVARCRGPRRRDRPTVPSMPRRVRIIGVWGPRPAANLAAHLVARHSGRGELRALYSRRRGREARCSGPGRACAAIAHQPSQAYDDNFSLRRRRLDR
jgi:hypothetical protein